MTGIGRRFERTTISWSQGLADAVALFVSLRVLFALIALYFWWTETSVPPPCHFELARNGWLTLPPLAQDGASFPLVGVWQRWDACWYTKIATFGYEPGVDSVNFWPLFPVLTGIVGRLLGGAMALGGLVVAGAGYIAAMTGLHRLVARDFDGDVAFRTVVAISIFPTAFFFFAPFTESLFLATAVWAIVGARERRWWLAALAALLASLTRIQGVFLAFPIGWELLVAAGLLEWRPGRDLRAWWPRIREHLAGAAAVLAPGAGFLGFLAYSSATVGMTPLDTQDAWGGKEFFAPWDVAAASWAWAVERHDPLQALNLATLALFAFVTIAGLRRVPFAYSLFALPQIALLATRIQPTPLTSTARYLLVVFPVFVILAQVEGRNLRLAWLIGSVLFLAVLLGFFLQGNYVA
jgi:hypothetical protein